MTSKKFAWILLGYTLLVILWGAWVRISFSGDGCGDHWPLCNGDFVPQASGKTWTEYTHRLMSGFYGIAVVAFFFAVRRITPRQHPARLWSLLTLIFMISEALLGAKLVLLRLVGTNDSPLRAGSMGLHLMNSLMLVGSLTLTALFLGSHSWKRRSQSAIHLDRRSLRKFVVALGVGFLFLNISGALAALSTTLFPAENFMDSMQAQLSSTHYLMSLRSFHPLLGVVFGVGFAAFGLSLRALSPLPEIRTAAALFAATAGLTLGVGAATLFLASPVWLKLSHLTMTYVLWITALNLIQTLIFSGESPRQLGTTA